MRPGWDDYFMKLVDSVGERGTCDRGRSGCIIVREHRILSTGYVGAPSGLPHCNEAGHLLRTVTYEDGSKRTHCMRTLHAEVNAILQAARFGIRVEGAALYCHMEPCVNCAMMILNVGINRVVARFRYQAGADSRLLLADRLFVLEDRLQDYPV